MCGEEMMWFRRPAVVDQRAITRGFGPEPAELLCGNQNGTTMRGKTGAQALMSEDTHCQYNLGRWLASRFDLFSRANVHHARLNLPSILRAARQASARPAFPSHLVTEPGLSDHNALEKGLILPYAIRPSSGFTSDLKELTGHLLSQLTSLAEDRQGWKSFGDSLVAPDCYGTDENSPQDVIQALMKTDEVQAGPIGRRIVMVIV
ncbi:hypothetical protein Bbelb_336290 [Branchiostoma belcheri]|nr:hypothetical protein Bbelb_336290 [Branchiostoma belcheri]